VLPRLARDHLSMRDSGADGIGSDRPRPREARGRRLYTPFDEAYLAQLGNAARAFASEQDPLTEVVTAGKLDRDRSQSLHGPTWAQALSRGESEDAPAASKPTIPVTKNAWPGPTAQTGLETGPRPAPPDAANARRAKRPGLGLPASPERPDIPGGVRSGSVDDPTRLKEVGIARLPRSRPASAYVDWAPKESGSRRRQSVPEGSAMADALVSLGTVRHEQRSAPMGRTAYPEAAREQAATLRRWPFDVVAATAAADLLARTAGVSVPTVMGTVASEWRGFAEELREDDPAGAALPQLV
jgi:hypothetical protein